MSHAHAAPAALCLTFALLTACATGAPASSSAKRSGPLVLPADFELFDPAGASIALGDAVGGRIAVIDFWATWCKPCRKSLPEVDQLAASVDAARVAVIAVNVGDKPEHVAAFQKELGLSLSILRDPTLELPPLLDIHGLPRLIVVGSDGRVAHVGKNLDAEARARLQALLDVARQSTAD